MPISEADSYIDEQSAGLEIYFGARRLSLGDIGLVASSVDYMLNKAAVVMAGIPVVEPIMFEEWFFRRRWYPYLYPILTTAEVTDLNFESFSAKTRVKLHRILRDYSVNITSGLIVAAIVAAFAANGGKANIEMTRPDRLPDLGPNITSLSQSLSATGKPWELRIKDSQTGVEVTLKGNQRTRHRRGDR
jgi:hypothetical protein